MDLHVTTHCAPPPGFLLASGCARKARHLSGPENVALTQIYQIGLAGLTNQCNQDRLMVHHPALHLESRSFPPQRALGAPLHFHYALFFFLLLFFIREKRVSTAPFHSQHCRTPRSVFQDGSNNEGSPLLHLGVRCECEFRFSLASSTTAPTNPLTGARVFEAR